ncbi:MAG: extracellular solute-binding protein [Chloroflexi bacterium]|nr:extracellular solute-binding protein [Chloroflexota bacterium]
MKRFAVIAVMLVAAFSFGASAQEPVEITFAHIFGGEQDSRVEVIRAIADEFQAANPGVTITLVSPSTDYTELFNSALLSASQGDAPTIVQVEEGLTQLAADSQFFTPIGDLATPEQLASLDDVLPVVRSYYAIGDTLWSLPWNSSNPILFYNRGMFELAGLDPDTPPATFADLTAACESIMSRREQLGVDACVNWPMATWFVEQWVAMQDALIANNDNGRTARASEMLYTDPAVKSVVEWWADLATKGFYTYSGTPNDYTGEGIAFLSKRTAITINSTAGITLFNQFSVVQGIELGIAGLPVPNAEATNGGTVGGASVWISAGATDAQKRAATDFLFFLTSTENDIKWHKGSGYFPNRVTSIEALTAEGWFETAPAFGIALGQLQAAGGTIANAGAVIGPSAEVRGFLVSAIQSIIDGGETVDAALEAAKAQADATLADYNTLVGE